MKIKVICYILSVLLFVSGIAIFVFPFINRAEINKASEQAIDSFRYNRGLVEADKNSGGESGSDKNKSSDFQRLYRDMQKYNEDIFIDGQKDLSDAWSYQQSGFDLSQYGIYDGVIGEIRIPAMDCDLPLFLGATMNNMAKGAAVLGQTSMPIGGENTNCVIAGHRGAAGGKFFLDIENLKTGDRLYIDNLWETLTYRVSKISVIKPDEIDKVLIQPSKDMITLTTCHPYPYNYQRYIVYCERMTDDSTMQSTSAVPEGSAQAEEESTLVGNTLQNNDEKINSAGPFIFFEKAMYVIVPIALVVLAIILLKRK